MRNIKEKFSDNMERYKEQSEITLNLIVQRWYRARCYSPLSAPPCHSMHALYLSIGFSICTYIFLNFLTKEIIYTCSLSLFNHLFSNEQLAFFSFSLILNCVNEYCLCMYLRLSHCFLRTDCWDGVFICILTCMPGFHSRKFTRSCSHQLCANRLDTIDSILNYFLLRL